MNNRPHWTSAEWPAKPTTKVNPRWTSSKASRKSMENPRSVEVRYNMSNNDMWAGKEVDPDQWLERGSRATSYLRLWTSIRTETTQSHVSSAVLPNSTSNESTWKSKTTPCTNLPSSLLMTPQFWGEDRFPRGRHLMRGSRGPVQTCQILRTLGLKSWNWSSRRSSWSIRSWGRSWRLRLWSTQQRPKNPRISWARTRARRSLNPKSWKLAKDYHQKSRRRDKDPNKAKAGRVRKFDRASFWRMLNLDRLGPRANRGKIISINTALK